MHSIGIKPIQIINVVTILSRRKSAGLAPPVTMMSATVDAMSNWKPNVPALRRSPKSLDGGQQVIFHCFAIVLA